MTTHRFTDYVIPQMLRWHDQGLASALVTIVHVEGSGPRPAGSQIAVSQHGETIGQITSGCAETAIAEHAVAHIEAGTNGLFRFGVGSPLVDIKLPCGSGLDIDFRTDLPIERLGDLHRLLTERKAAELVWGDAIPTTVTPINRTGFETTISRDAQSCRRSYVPKPRLIAIGAGANLTALIALACELDWLVEAVVPEGTMLESAAGSSALTVHQLATPADFQAIELDPWTACAFMFHEHTWEPHMLKHILDHDCFYVGALGSRANHALRSDALATLGCNDEQIARIHAPIGFKLGASDPQTIALGTLAEIQAAQTSIGTS